MSDPADFEAPGSPPPPAYEFCQQEFDQKVSHALEASQSEPQPWFEDEGWEEWDEEKFAAAAARMALNENAAAGSSTLPAPAPAPPVPVVASTSSPSPVQGNGKAKSEEPANEWRAEVQPLRIAKKNTRREKERPSWYAEARLGEQPPRRPTLHVSNGSSAAPTTRIMSPPPPMSAYPEERNNTPPPMFTAVDNSLDGPPYEGVVMSYVPGESRPASPLHSPPPIAAPTPFNASHSSSPPLGRRSLPQPPQANARPYTPSISPSARLQYQQHQSLPAPARQLPQRMSPRPTTTYSLKPPNFAPRVTFDPRVAYGSAKSSLFSNAPVEEPPPAKIDAAALYSSSVASLYSSSIPAAPPRVQPSAPSSFYSQPNSQSTYHVPQVASTTRPGIGGYYPNRDNAKSPAPSVMSTLSSHSQNQQSGYRPASTYQSNNAYQPTSYQATTYQPTAYQPTTYRPTSY